MTAQDKKEVGNINDLMSFVYSLIPHKNYLIRIMSIREMVRVWRQEVLLQEIDRG